MVQHKILTSQSILHIADSKYFDSSNASKSISLINRQHKESKFGVDIKVKPTSDAVTLVLLNDNYFPKKVNGLKLKKFTSRIEVPSRQVIIFGSDLESQVLLLVHQPSVEVFFGINHASQVFLYVSGQHY